MVPAAPERLSKITCCPSGPDKRCASARPSTSLTLVPAGKGMMILTGRFGKPLDAVCAPADRETRRNSPAATACALVIITLPFLMRLLRATANIDQIHGLPTGFCATSWQRQYAVRHN